MTVEIAAIYMLVWDLSFLTKLKQMCIKLSVYKQYVDDIVIVMRLIEAGWYFDGKKGKLVFNPEHEYALLEPDLRTMSVLRDITNRLDSDIQLTIDVPSQNASGRLPVLDLELSVIENDKIQFVFYKKPIANPRVISYTSAISSRIKRDTLLMEAYRRIRNCSIGVQEDIVNRFLSNV